MDPDDGWPRHRCPTIADDAERSNDALAAEVEDSTGVSSPGAAIHAVDSSPSTAAPARRRGWDLNGRCGRDDGGARVKVTIDLPAGTSRTVATSS